MKTSHSLLTVLAFLVASCTAPTVTGDIVVITNALIVDGLGGPPVVDGVIVVSGDRIEGLGPAGSLSIPDGAEVIDAQGQTVMPGLADMHVHLAGGWDGEGTDLLGYQRYLDALLYSGVTTVLDTGGVLLFLQQLVQEVEAGRITGPRIMFVGPLLDGPEPIWPPISYRVSSVDQIEPMVVDLAGWGVDALKAYGSLPDSMLAMLVEAGREQGLPVIADVRGNGSMGTAATGLHALAHAGFAPIEDAVISLMVGSGVATITTLAVTESFSRRRFEDLTFLENPLLSRTMPPRFVEDLRAHATQELDPIGQTNARFFARALEAGRQNVRRLHEGGALLVAGTDSPYPGVFYGEGLHRELELLVEAGLTPLEAISAATLNAAKLMLADDRWGTLQAGRVADILFIDGRPHENIGDTRNITLVMQGGRVLDRSSLEFDGTRDAGFRMTRPIHD